MRSVSYELVSQGGRTVYSADTLPLARGKQEELAGRGVNVRVERVQIMRRSMERAA